MTATQQEALREYAAATVALRSYEAQMRARGGYSKHDERWAAALNRRSEATAALGVRDYCEADLLVFDSYAALVGASQ